MMELGGVRSQHRIGVAEADLHDFRARHYSDGQARVEAVKQSPLHRRSQFRDVVDITAHRIASRELWLTVEPQSIHHLDRYCIAPNDFDLGFNERIHIG
jgi:hypothetical protein